MNIRITKNTPSFTVKYLKKRKEIPLPVKKISCNMGPDKETSQKYLKR
jgi:hypothetical protein